MVMVLHVQVECALLPPVSQSSPQIYYRAYTLSYPEQCQTVGASLNLSKACDTKGDTSCQVSCQDPSNSGRCLVLQAQLINGSPCGNSVIIIISPLCF